MTAGRAGAPLLATLLALAAALTLLLARAPPRADLASFLPPGQTQATSFLFRELQSGAAATLLLGAVEGTAPRAEIARVARETAAALRASGRFDFVGDGTLRLSEAEEAALFRHRYLLSPATTPEAFAAAALRPKLEALLDGLRSMASPLLVRFGFADPTGAFLGLAGALLSDSRLETEHGAWFAAAVAGAPPRALLVARGRDAALGSVAQAEAVAAFRAAFAAANPPPDVGLLLSGPAVFAEESAARIRADVERISLLATLLLAAFLLWRFRSVLLLGLVAVPLLAAIVAGYGATLLAFGEVHAIALGFGMTMLGVAVDYPILLVTLRHAEEDVGAAAVRIWPALRLAAAAAVASLLAMLGSGLPGLAQLAVFAGTGLAVAALATRFLLPRLVPPGARIAARPLPAPLAAALLRLTGRRGSALAAIIATGGVLLATGGPARQSDLAALSPVPARQQALDAELRAQLGAPDVRSLFVIGPAATEEAVLQRAEALEAALAPLVAAGLLERLDSPARWLPSAATQRARQQALPDMATLSAALGEATAGLPFRPGAFAPFLAAVEESRALPPLDVATLGRLAPLVAARVAPLLARHDGASWGVAPVVGVHDPVALEAAAAALGVPGVLFLDLKLEMDRLLAAYGRAMALWAGLGAAAVLALLALGLRRPGQVLAVAVPILGALLAVLAWLALRGDALGLFDLAALLLLAGLAIDYSLFLARSTADAAGEDGNDHAQARLGAVLNCAVSTLLTFGLLSTCETPVLHGIGRTVALGVAAAFLLACALSPRVREGR